MILGRVVGTVWSTRKHASLSQYKLMLVRPYFYYNPAHETEQLVAIDTIDAGIGDDVVVCLGSPARWSLGSSNLPVDAAILGIVDRCQFVQEAFDRRASRQLRFIGDQRPKNLEWI
ncbi:MAG: EutN/CcmL family microcompartment protein [Pseudomonadota bacterium]